MVEKIESQVKEALKTLETQRTPQINNTISFDFEKYLLGYYSGHHMMTARIYCFKGDKRVGTVEFIKEGQQIQDNFYDPSKGGWGIYLFYRESQFKDILSIIQSIKTLSIWIETNSKLGGIVSPPNIPIGKP